MLPIGKEPRRPVSGISQAYPDRVEVRGRDLTGDLMGRLTFTEYVHLLLTGDEPTDAQRFFLDLLLVSIAEHGMMPTNVAARMTLAADPTALQAAVAAGILGAGPVVLGASEECAWLLADASARVTAGERPEDVVADVGSALGLLDGDHRLAGAGAPGHDEALVPSLSIEDRGLLVRESHHRLLLVEELLRHRHLDADVG